MGYPIAENGSHSALDCGDKYLISWGLRRIELPTFGLQPLPYR
jgi:hypothetical protein